VEIRGWDMLDSAADGPYWKRRIDETLEATMTAKTDVATLDAFVESIVSRAIAASSSGSDEPAQDWQTDDTITFGAWREAIRAAVMEFALPAGPIARGLAGETTGPARPMSEELFWEAWDAISTTMGTSGGQ